MTGSEAKIGNCRCGVSNLVCACTSCEKVKEGQRHRAACNDPACVVCVPLAQSRPAPCNCPSGMLCRHRFARLIAGPREPLYPAPPEQPPPHITPMGNGVWRCRCSGDIFPQDCRVGYGNSAERAWNAWCAAWGTHLDLRA